jgi:hypothetical protein
MWVIFERKGLSALCPVYPSDRTADITGGPIRATSKTHAVQQYALLFDHLVWRWRLVIVDCQVERHRSPMIEMSPEGRKDWYL